MTSSSECHGVRGGRNGYVGGVFLGGELGSGDKC